MKTRFIVPILFIASIVLAGCDLISSPTPTPLPTMVPENTGDTAVRKGYTVIASGKVAPALLANLGFEGAGRVLSAEIAEDDIVESGQLLAQLEGQGTLEAAVIAAEFEILAAQQALDALEENKNLAQAAAYQEIVSANQIIGDTQYRLYNLTVPAAYAGIETKEALEIAKEKLEAAREAFEPYRYKPSSDDTRKDLKEAVERARSDFNAILRMIELEATLKTAYANLEQAELKHKTLAEGPDPDEVALAAARLRNAEAQLRVAQEALESLSLYAPIEGTAVSVDILPGETVLPGQKVITLADLKELQVETSDLSERDVAQVAVGQKALVYIEALNTEVPGSVLRISPQANVLGGDVVYTVVIELDEQPDDLRWGMSVEVTIETE